MKYSSNFDIVFMIKIKITRNAWCAAYLRSQSPLQCVQSIKKRQIRKNVRMSLSVYTMLLLLHQT